MSGFAAALSRKNLGEIGTLLASSALLISVTTAVSIGMQGFIFEFGNNVFHVPIVLRFENLPQFSHDPFVQSLEKFVSPVYLLLSSVANERNIASLFLLCHVLTRATTFLAFLMICAAAGVPAGWRRAAVLAVLAIARAVYGSSPVGDAGLLLPWFSHSELAQAVALVATAFMMWGKLLPATIAVGAAFDINAFVGIWMGVPLAMVLLADFVASPAPLRTRVLEAGRVVLALAATALPVALWIFTALPSKPIEFDYPEFLHYYFERHFFLSASSPAQITTILLIVSTGGAALKVLHLDARASASFVGLLVVFAVGIVVGAASHSPLMLNLHLIRVDGLMLLVTAALVASAGILMLDAARPMQTLAGGALCVGLIAKTWFMAPFILVAFSVAGKGLDRFSVGRLARILARPMAMLQALVARYPNAPALVSCLAFLAYAAAAGVVQRARLGYAGGMPTNNQLNGLHPPAPQWRGVATWAREQTDPGATFLVPLTINGFRVAAQRQVWVDWKEGAAAMWVPEFHHDWYSRVQAVKRLQTPTALFKYACENRLDYLIIDKRDAAMRDPLPGLPAAYSNDVFNAYTVDGCAGVGSSRVRPAG